MHDGGGIAQLQCDHDHAKLPGKGHCDLLHAPAVLAFQDFGWLTNVLPGAAVVQKGDEDFIYILEKRRGYK